MSRAYRLDCHETQVSSQPIHPDRCVLPRAYIYLCAVNSSFEFRNRSFLFLRRDLICTGCVCSCEYTSHNTWVVIHRYHIVPRVLRDVSDVDMSTTILGHRISFPVCIAPTAMQRMAHPEGEVATARGRPTPHDQLSICISLFISISLFLRHASDIM